jgi:hypothetical protein
MVSINAEYKITTFIRQGQAKIKTCYITEAMYPGDVMNVQDFTEFDMGDTDLGVFLNDMALSKNMGSECTISQRGYYVPMNDAAGCEVRMTADATGTIAAGAYVKVTTGGRITTWTYANSAVGTDTLRDVIGRTSESIVASSTGWVKLGRV